MAEIAQKKLGSEQIAAFYSDTLTLDQVRHFSSLTAGRLSPRRRVVDIGGGCGFFAASVQRALGVAARVIDMDAKSVQIATQNGVEAEIGDAIEPVARGDEGVVTFNLILHHLVADTETETRELQKRALAAWYGKAEYVFVNEYVYEAPGGLDLAGRLIYEITSSKLLSEIARVISKPHALRFLRANTFGVGVRFRSDASWRRLFSECGYEVIGTEPGPFEPMPLVRRALFIKSKRRDSYLLRAR